MSNMYFMCENCGIETNGITLVNGMKFCAKCYQETFGKYNQQNEIQQLKQQLDHANEKIMWLNAEIDTLKSEKENLMRTLEEAEKKLQELRGGE